MPLPLITVQSFNQTSLQAAGAVFVQRVESVSIARGVLSGITGLVGGRNELMEKKMNDLTQALLDELDAKAKKVYPTAIGLVDANIHFSTTGPDSSMILVGQASATVLIKRVKPLTTSLSSSPAPLANPVPLASPVPMGLSSQPPAQKDPQLLIKGMPMVSGPEDPMPVKGGTREKRRTFLTKRLIKPSRKNRK
jgi:uncharacterized protein YbjQ (UPF0145 family)